MKASGEKVDRYAVTENPQGFRGSFPGLRRSGTDGRKYRTAREVGLPGAIARERPCKKATRKFETGKGKKGNPVTRQHETHAG